MENGKNYPELIRLKMYELAELIREQAFHEAQARIAGIILTPGGGIERPAIVAPPTNGHATTTTTTPAKAKPAKPKASGRHYPPHCLAEGCTKPHKGPRASFMCEDHFGLPKKDKKAALTTWKAAQA